MEDAALITVRVRAPGPEGAALRPPPEAAITLPSMLMER